MSDGDSPAECGEREITRFAFPVKRAGGIECAPMRTRALAGALFLVASAVHCGGAKGLPKGPAPEYEEDPAVDAGAPSPSLELPAAHPADAGAATSAVLP